MLTYTIGNELPVVWRYIDIEPHLLGEPKQEKNLALSTIQPSIAISSARGAQNITTILAKAFIKYEPLSRFQWPSNNISDQFSLLNLATGEIVTTIQGVIAGIVPSNWPPIYQN
jgi:hypothetical protein